MTTAAADGAPEVASSRTTEDQHSRKQQREQLGDTPMDLEQVRFLPNINVTSDPVTGKALQEANITVLPAWM